MGLDGIAGRQLLGRLSAGMRERKRAADNDNICRQPEVTRRHREAEAAALGRNEAHRRTVSASRKNEATIPMTEPALAPITADQALR
jgi:hypothetical protein